MSKIYEALLRAEIDRLTNNGKIAESTSTEGAPARPAEPFPAEPVSTRNAQTEPTADPVIASSHAGEYGEISLDSAAIEPLSLEQVRKVQWSPDVKRLPALLQRGRAVEQVRGFRSRISDLRFETPLKTILVSSGLPEEGKSFVTANLAISFANHKSSRVLLIDGDMRRGTLHKLLGAPQTPGLAEFLNGSADLHSIIQKAKVDETQQEALKGFHSLYFIPCGNDAENAADLSGNGRFEKLLAAVSDQFDWIVVDSSPVNLVADGVNLARSCDGVVLVARGGTTRYETAQLALDKLKAAKLLGVVLNAVHGVSPIGGYYGYDK
jgi:protein-tyrosine kinase